MVHSFKFDKFNIVIDVNSGAIHILDDIASDVLSNINGSFFQFSKNLILKKLENKYEKVSIIEAFDELLTLHKNGVLFSEDEIFKAEQKRKSESKIKALCLNVSHDCNLKCSYCFVSKGNFGCERQLMSFETAKLAIDFLIQNSQDRHNLEVDFFGGEPLMNFEIIKKVVEYAKNLERIHNKNFRFSITTNGLLLNDEISDYLAKEMYNIVLSLDGRKEVNDNFRKTAANLGSYEFIVPKFKKLFEKRNNNRCFIRGTFTKKNLDFSKDVLHIRDLGFVDISVTPVICENNLDYAITENDLETILKEYEILAEKIIKIKKRGEEINFSHLMLNLDKPPCAIKKLKGCGCGNECIAVTPNGNIFPCHQFVGRENFKLGNINKKTFDREPTKKFLKTNVYHKEECKRCWAKFFCSGGCSANNHLFNGDIMKPHKVSCEILKKRIECALGIKVALSMQK